MRILQQGGNAADAAVAMAAALNVTEPTSTGIGGDVFALFWDAAAKEMKCDVLLKHCWGEADVQRKTLADCSYRHWHVVCVGSAGMLTKADSTLPACITLRATFCPAITAVAPHLLHTASVTARAWHSCLLKTSAG